ncbi:hypothetical protein [Clostridium sp. C105KSO13]|uniref:hypothetical protein n=1 Tax=Clostridium sp. C105KSO13 TaxID=1776045 RepID=UPI001146ECD3|nr:hypothetical protein [Clostridium sp. C105KSO13]
MASVCPRNWQGCWLLCDEFGTLLKIESSAKGELRQMFGMVLQDTWLFHGTIRDYTSSVDCTQGYRYIDDTGNIFYIKFPL